MNYPNQPQVSAWVARAKRYHRAWRYNGHGLNRAEAGSAMDKARFLKVTGKTALYEREYSDWVWGRGIWEVAK